MAAGVGGPIGLTTAIVKPDNPDGGGIGVLNVIVGSLFVYFGVLAL